MLHTPDTISTLRHLLTACRTIAVVGLSPQWHRPSYFAAKYMQAHGYRIVPVNPLVAREGAQILGEAAYTSVTEAAAALAAQGQKIDMVDCFQARRPARRGGGPASHSKPLREDRTRASVWRPGLDGREHARDQRQALAAAALLAN